MQGFLLLNKPQGITSFGAVSRIKRLTNEKRVGHTGTLDPMATGVLPIFIGRATALSSFVLESEKTYRATVKLGVTTDSLDITGKVLSKTDVNISNEELETVLKKFLGRQLQTPPMFSAIRKDGVRMYELARKGEFVDIPQREIEVFSLKLINGIGKENEFSVEATVSKGTYIRSLCADIGKALGCGAVLTALERTFVSGFSVGECVRLDDLNCENIGEYIKSPDLALPYFEKVSVTQKQAVRFTNGGQLDLDRLKRNSFKDGEILKVFFENIFLGLGYTDLKNNQLAIKCIINKV